MQKKIDWPGRAIKINGEYWWNGCGVRGTGKEVFYPLQKSTLCDRINANGCSKPARWYGYETIGPRVYALYRCSDHGITRSRLVSQFKEHRNK